MRKIENKIYHILRWSEKYTRTDMVYLAKGGFWLTVSRVISFVIIISSAIVFANFLSKEIYGIYKFIISIAGIIGAFSLSGMGPAITRIISKGFDGALRTGAQVALKWNSSLFFIGIAISVYYYLNGNNELSMALLIVAIFLPFKRTFSIYDSYLQGKKLFKLRALYGGLGDGIPIVILILTAIFFNSFLLMVLAFFASYTIMNILLYLIVIKKYKLKKEPAPEVISYGKHLSVMDILRNIAAQLDNILLFHFVGPAQLAIYSFATAPPREITTLNSILQTLTLPKVSNRSIEELKKTLPRKVLITFLVSLFLFIAYVIVAPYIFKIIFPQYIDSIFLSQIFAINILFAPGILFHQTLVGHMQKKKLYIINSVIPIIKIILLFLLLPFYGVWGAISAILFTRTVQFIMLFYFFKKL